MKGFQKSYLRGLGQTLRPSVQLGKKGIDQALLRELERAFDQQELVKVRFAALKDQKRELANRLASESGADLAGVVGHTALLYRPHRDPERRTLRLPEREDAPPPQQSKPS